MNDIQTGKQFIWKLQCNSIMLEEFGSGAAYAYYGNN